MKTLKTFDFTKKQLGRKPKYQWSNWLDGKIHEIKRSTDFTCTLLTMQAQIYKQTSVLDNVKITHCNIVDNATIVFQVEFNN